MRPTTFSHSCTVSKQISYSALDGSPKGTQPGVGTLQIGRVVWLDHKLGSVPGKTTVQAYVDGIGLIRVDPGSLSAVC